MNFMISSSTKTALTCAIVLLAMDLRDEGKAETVDAERIAGLAPVKEHAQRRRGRRRASRSDPAPTAVDAGA